MNSRYKIKSSYMSYDEYNDRYDNYPAFLPIRVVCVKPANLEMETYDLSIDGNHEYFCGEGLLNHNSAQIAIGDCKDEEYLRAKRWD